MRKLSKNEKIILAAVIIMAVILLPSMLEYFGIRPLGDIGFRPVQNRNTGEPLSLLMSIFLYVLLGLVIGLIPYAVLWLTAFFTYHFLHRKEKLLERRAFNPPSDKELDFGVAVAGWINYVLVYLVIMLCAFGVLTV